MIVTVDYSELKKKAQSNPFEDHDRNDPHPFFAWFYKRGEKVYSIDKDHPFSSIHELEKGSAASLGDMKKYAVIRCIELDYPGSFQEMTQKTIEQYYLAEDEVTLIEATKDLARATGFALYREGEKAVVTDNFLKKKLLL